MPDKKHEKNNKETPTKKSRSLGLSKAEKIAIPIIIIIAVWVVYSVVQPSPGPGSSNLQVTYSTKSISGGAPDFTLPVVDSNGLTGQMLTLSSFRGNVVVLEFMEPWCVHCQNMAPVIDKVYGLYGNTNQSVVFISVAGPWNSATAGDAAKFIKYYKTDWVYVYDSSGVVFSDYGVNSTPTFFIIGKDGSVLTSFSGEQSAEAISTAIARALSS